MKQNITAVELFPGTALEIHKLYYQIKYLEKDEHIDYDKLRLLLVMAADKQSIILDNIFDWISNKH